MNKKTSPKICSRVRLPDMPKPNAAIIINSVNLFKIEIFSISVSHTSLDTRYME